MSGFRCTLRWANRAASHCRFGNVSGGRVRGVAMLVAEVVIMAAREDTGPGERATLAGILDGLRESIAGKAAGVPEPAVREAGVPSGTSLLGLVKHLTHVERFYFLGTPMPAMRRTFRPGRAETTEGLIAAYREAAAEADAVVRTWTDLGDAAPHTPGRTRRWVLAHMIEETARHAGHADILRERIDGSAGR
jgi:hypothetical protein